MQLPIYQSRRTQISGAAVVVVVKREEKVRQEILAKDGEGGGDFGLPIKRSSALPIGRDVQRRGYRGGALRLHHTPS